MGAGSSTEVPGGGSEGYHVLRVIIFILNAFIIVMLELGLQNKFPLTHQTLCLSNLPLPSSVSSLGYFLCYGFYLMSVFLQYVVQIIH